MTSVGQVARETQRNRQVAPVGSDSQRDITPPEVGPLTLSQHHAQDQRKLNEFMKHRPDLAEKLEKEHPGLFAGRHKPSAEGFLVVDGISGPRYHMVRTLAQSETARLNLENKLPLPDEVAKGLARERGSKSFGPATAHAIDAMTKVSPPSAAAPLSTGGKGPGASEAASATPASAREATVSPNVLEANLRKPALPIEGIPTKYYRDDSEIAIAKDLLTAAGVTNPNAYISFDRTRLPGLGGARWNPLAGIELDTFNGTGAKMYRGDLVLPEGDRKFTTVPVWKDNRGNYGIVDQNLETSNPAMFHAAVQGLTHHPGYRVHGAVTRGDDTTVLLTQATSGRTSIIKYTVTNGKAASKELDVPAVAALQKEEPALFS